MSFGRKNRAVWAMVTASALALSASFAAAAPEATVSAPQITLDASNIDRLVAAEIYFSHVSADMQARVQGWDFELKLVGGGPDSVHLFSATSGKPNLDALTPIEHPYFFRSARSPDDADSSVGIPLIPPRDDTFTSTNILVAGFASVGNPQPIVEGDGVLRVQFIIPAGVSGNYPLKFNPNFFDFVDSEANPIAGINAANGFIRIVPEPVAVIWIGVGLAILPARGRSQRHAD